MPAFLGMAILVGLGWALRGSWSNVRASQGQAKTAAVRRRATELGRNPDPREKRRIERRTRSGWWAREVTGGFPVSRTGFWSGWISHRTAHGRARAVLTNARLEDLRSREARARAEAEYRRERGQILNDINDVIRDGAPERPTRRGVKTAAGAVILPFRPRTEPEGGEAEVPVPEQKDDEPVCASCGHPAAPGVPLAADHDGRLVHQPSPRAASQPQPVTGNSQPGGEQPMSEFGFRGTVAAAQQHAAAAEQDAATIQARILALRAIIDSMHADEVDPATVAESMDLLEKYVAAKAALDACNEGSTLFAGNLSRRHEQLAEAHENAPVPHAARREFYETV